MSPDAKAAMDAWLAEMERLPRGKGDDAGHTAKELCGLLDKSYPTVMKRLQEMHAAGTLKVGTRRVLKLNGRSDLVPVYQLVKPKRK